MRKSDRTILTLVLVAAAAYIFTRQKTMTVSGLGKFTPAWYHPKAPLAPHSNANFHFGPTSPYAAPTPWQAKQEASVKATGHLIVRKNQPGVWFQGNYQGTVTDVRNSLITDALASGMSHAAAEQYATAHLQRMDIRTPT